MGIVETNQHLGHNKRSHGDSFSVSASSALQSRACCGRCTNPLRGSYL